MAGKGKFQWNNSAAGNAPQWFIDAVSAGDIQIGVIPPLPAEMEQNLPKHGLAALMPAADIAVAQNEAPHLLVKTANGIERVNEGDWIVQAAGALHTVNKDHKIV